MKTGPVSLDDLSRRVRCAAAGPPAGCRATASTSIRTNVLVRHMLAGGLTRLLYGGNAFLYHVTRESSSRCSAGWRSMPDDVWAIPSIGPVLWPRASIRRGCVSTVRFPTVMLLPCGDPRDAAGLERGISEIADAAGVPLVVYREGRRQLRPRSGSPAWTRWRGSSTSARSSAPSSTPSCGRTRRTIRISTRLLARVDRRRVISGMGERPAVVHLRHRRLPGFTTGSGCVAPALSQSVFEAASNGRLDGGRRRPRADFLPLEDVRDALGPGARAARRGRRGRPRRRPGRFLRSSASWTDGQRAEVRASGPALAERRVALPARSARVSQRR